MFPLFSLCVILKYMTLFRSRNKTKSNPLLISIVGSRVFEALLYTVKESGGIEKILKKKRIPNSAEHPEKPILLLGDMVRETVREFGIPARVIVGFLAGGAFSEQSFVSWSVRPRHKQTRLARNDLGTYFQSAFEQHRKKDCMTIACPVGIAFNGYSINFPFFAREERGVHELEFQAIIASFSQEAAQAFSRLRESFPALAFDCIPLSAAHQYALSDIAKEKEFFIVDVADDCTVLCVVREKTMSAFSSFNHHAIPLSRGENSIEQWKRSFLLARDDFFPAGGIPRDVYVFGDAWNVLSSHVPPSFFISDFSHENVPHIHYMRGAAFFGGESFRGALAGESDARLASLFYYALNYRPVLS